MTVWPKDNDADLDAFYGRPNGSANWEVTNLVYIVPPWRIWLAGTDIEMAHGIRIHRQVAADLTSIFEEIWNAYGRSQKLIEDADLHQIGGAYYFRARRGSKRLSNHARGIAIDIDPQDNAMGHKTGDIPVAVVNIFKAHGWRWGGDYKGTKDFMHFEACS